MKIDIEAVIKWVGVLQRLRAAGQPALDAVRQALAAHGIEADNALLDAVIADDIRREAIARKDAAGGTDVGGSVAAGS